MTQIRESIPSDRKRLAELVTELHSFVRQFDKNMPDAGDIIEKYMLYLDNRCKDEDGCLFVAEQNGRLVGYVCVFSKVVAHDPDDDPRPFAVIQDIHVTFASQGLGLGKALLEAAELFARQRGALKIQLSVFSANSPAIGFYEHMRYRDHVRIYLKDLQSLERNGE